MKIHVAALGCLLLPLLPLSAQVTVDVTLEQEQFLPGESLPTAVRITNRSGQTLRFGSEPDWLVFSVESSDGFVVVKNSEVPVLGEFAVESSQMATRRVDLAPHFVLSRTGRYKVTATVRVREWDTILNSSPTAFDIINGARLWTQEFGVPLAPGVTNEVPEVRKYILQQANYLRTQLRLYLRLTDAAESRLIKVFPIGPMVSFSRPEPQLDKFSNLHLLFQDGARSFNYTVVNPDGEVVLRQTYEYLNTRPRLQVDESGKIVVTGGVRRLATSDVPAPQIPARP
ncbi:MAG: hypothetical protein KIS67_06620 [Verrucomicrobiae bacterium]|nr:hypothetical protein [Verrucomicrobiae bacterium]